MEYGHTGSEAPASLAPVPSEDEMTKLQDIFRRAAQAIVDVSGLSAKVSELSAKVETLTTEIDGYRNRVRWLDTELDEVRASRNEQRERADRAEAEARQAKARNDEQAQVIVDKDQQITDLTDERDSARVARDNAELRVMELEDKLARSEARLDKLRTFAVEEFGLREPQPDPTPEPQSPLPSVPSNPPPAQEAPAPDPFPEVDYSRPHHWSTALGRYVND